MKTQFLKSKMIHLLTTIILCGTNLHALTVATQEQATAVTNLKSLELPQAQAGNIYTFLLDPTQTGPINFLSPEQQDVVKQLAGILQSAPIPIKNSISENIYNNLSAGTFNTVSVQALTTDQQSWLAKAVTSSNLTGNQPAILTRAFLDTPALNQAQVNMLAETFTTIPDVGGVKLGAIASALVQNPTLTQTQLNTLGSTVVSLNMTIANNVSKLGTALVKNPTLTQQQLNMLRVQQIDSLTADQVSMIGNAVVSNNLTTQDSANKLRFNLVTYNLNQTQLNAIGAALAALPTGTIVGQLGYFLSQNPTLNKEQLDKIVSAFIANPKLTSEQLTTLARLEALKATAQENYTNAQAGNDDNAKKTAKDDLIIVTALYVKNLIDMGLSDGMVSSAKAGLHDLLASSLEGNASLKTDDPTEVLAGFGITPDGASESGITGLTTFVLDNPVSSAGSTKSIIPQSPVIGGATKNIW